MATATSATMVDGIVYGPGQEIPDLGSWVAKDVRSDYREYYGLSEDKDKLPKYCRTGSSAFCVDTLEIAYFDKSTNTWYWS